MGKYLKNLKTPVNDFTGTMYDSAGTLHYASVVITKPGRRNFTTVHRPIGRIEVRYFDGTREGHV